MKLSVPNHFHPNVRRKLATYAQSITCLDCFIKFHRWHSLTDSAYTCWSCIQTIVKPQNAQRLMQISPKTSPDRPINVSTNNSYVFAVPTPKENIGYFSTVTCAWALSTTLLDSYEGSWTHLVQTYHLWLFVGQPERKSVGCFQGSQHRIWTTKTVIPTAYQSTPIAL